MQLLKCSPSPYIEELNIAIGEETLKIAINIFLKPPLILLLTF
jgi:hypothetical protein